MATDKAKSVKEMFGKKNSKKGNKGQGKPAGGVNAPTSKKPKKK